MARSRSDSRGRGAGGRSVLTAGSSARKTSRSRLGPGSKAPARPSSAPRSGSARRPPPSPRAIRARRLVLLGIGALVLTLVLLVVIDSTSSYNKIHKGVTIAGQNMGGLTRDEAAAALTRYIDAAEQQPITLVSGESTWTVMPEDVGTSIDIAGTVETAMQVTRKSNFVVDFGRRLKLYSSSIDVPLQGTVDAAKMDAFVVDVAGDLDLPPVDAGLAVDDNGTVSTVEAQSGWVVDRAALQQQLSGLLFTLHGTELEVPMMVKEAEVKADEETTAMEQAKIILGAPVTLVYKDKTWTFSPKQIANYLGFSSEVVAGVSTLVPHISADKMSPFFTEISAEVGTQPVDATFDSDGTQAWVIPGVNGEVLDPEKTAAALTAATLKTSPRTAEVALVTKEPDRTTVEAQGMGIKDKLAGYTTEWDGGGWERAKNVRVATEYVTDVLVRPGDVYDFDKEIGPRTEERGFYLAKGITGPGKLEDVLGGGICQVSTTLFNAAFSAGLTIVERHNHSIRIAHYPLGRDATVTVGANMRFKNDTDNWILIRGSSTGIKTTFNIYGTDDGREVSYTTTELYDVVPTVVVSVTNTSLAWMTMGLAFEGQEGGRVMVERTVTWPDGTQKKDKFPSYWDMLPKKIEWGYGPTAGSN
jgi:vancomycin resistance protein YoaR